MSKTDSGPAANGRGLDPAAFRRVARLAEKEAGLSIPDGKLSMVQSRLARRLAATGLRDFAEYLDHVESTSGAEERSQMIMALTTNVTHFFREDHHFKTLSDSVLPELARRAASGGRVRIWSAGCSAGHEPYSIAMTVLAAMPDAGQRDVRILATDIDKKVLGIATAGIYSDRETASVPENLRRRHFTASGHSWRIGDEVRALVSFRVLNLVHEWPMRGRMDAVFCRNVLIYFSEETQRKLWPRFALTVAPGGTLFLGHSERMHDHGAHGFASVGVTTYRRVQTP